MPKKRKQSIPVVERSRKAADQAADVLNCSLFDPLADDLRGQMLRGVSIVEILSGLRQAMRHAVTDARLMSQGKDQEGAPFDVIAERRLKKARFIVGAIEL